MYMQSTRNILPFIVSFMFLMCATSIKAGTDELTALTHQPRGALSAGTQTVFKVNSEYHFRFVGDETIEYVIDLSHNNVRRGLIRVKEVALSDDAVPIAEGGLTWRHNSGEKDYEKPKCHADQCTFIRWLGTDFDDAAGTLRLHYRDTRDGNIGIKTYEFRLVGKVLRIRVMGDRSANSGFIGNYAGFHPGPSENTPDPVEQHIPYMDNVVVVRFGGDKFYSIYNDWYASNGSTVVFPDPPVTNGSSYEFNYVATSTRDENNEVLRNVEETVNLIVTKKISDTFPVSTYFSSPYHALTSGRMVVFGGHQRPNAWRDYKTLYDRFMDWGLTSLVIEQYQSRKWKIDLLTPDQDVAGIMGCKPENITTEPGIYYDSLGKAYHWVDPNRRENKFYADKEFKALAESARGTGAIFAHQVVHNDSDQWGYPPYPHGIHTQGNNNYYPVSIPLHFKGMKYGTINYGLLVPSSNQDFDPSSSVLKYNGDWKHGWDVSQNFFEDECTWKGFGYCHTMVDIHSTYDHLVTQLEYGKVNYQPNAVLWDASTKLPWSLNIDEISDSEKAHSIGEAMRAKPQILHQLREYIGGPLYGEATHLRRMQAYEHGGRDGVRWSYPDNDLDPHHENHDNWVIPDFNFREVIPVAAGHAGMGWEWKHWNLLDSLPFDGSDGDEPAFMDSWITTTLSYGNNPLVSTNGAHYSNFYTYQGILRQYAVMTDLARSMRESPVSSILYASPASLPHEYKTLEEVLNSSWGSDYLKNPRLKITFGNGLIFYANHDVAGSTNWDVTLRDLNSNPETLTLKPNGFAAGDGDNIFVFFNAKPTGTPGLPFDYIHSLNRLKMINNRSRAPGTSGVYSGVVYKGFPSSNINTHFTSSELDQFSEGMVMWNERLNRYICADGGLWNNDTETWFSGLVKTSPPGIMPAPLSLELKTNAATLFTNKPEGIIAIAHFDNGIWRDVTTLADWEVVSGDAGVDQSGAVTATNTGTVQVRASWQGFSQDHTLSAVNGDPVASFICPSQGYVNDPVVFDATASHDPKGGYIGYLWEFGDGIEEVNAGPKISHIYTTPGDYLVKLTVIDILDNTKTHTFRLNIQ